MKFKWYHILLIIITVICAAALAYGALNILNNKEDSSEKSTSKNMESSSDKLTKDINADNDEDKTGLYEDSTDSGNKEDYGDSEDEDSDVKSEADVGSEQVNTSEQSEQTSNTDKPELTLTLQGLESVELSWNKLENIDRYTIYRYDYGQKKWIRQVQTAQLSWTDKNVVPKEKCAYRLYAMEKKNGEYVRGNYDQKKIYVDTTVKALVVDKETNSSKRMVKYLKKARFDVTLAGSLDEFDVEDYDTLVIPGGHNITPSVYNAERDEHTYGTDLEVDKLQIAAIKEFKDAKKPILGVCRGCQVVNVALGGTIDQHIPGWHKKYRTVEIDRKSWLYPRLGSSESVYHYHHQCVDQLGEGLVATMFDEEDGRIEAIEHISLPIYGLQWHPDSMGDNGVDVFKYYKELVQDYYKNKEK